MMLEEFRINSNLEIPYKLIDVQEGSEQFTLFFKCFDSNQTEYSVESGGLTGQFEVVYNCCGISSKFDCDITIGNLYDFYVQLENTYECLPGIESVAILENYGSDKRSCMIFTFDKERRVVISGRFMDKGTFYKSGILFEIETDTFGVISEILNSLKSFFNELKRIQGHNTFY